MTDKSVQRGGVAVERSSLKSAHERIVEMLSSGALINPLSSSRPALLRLQPSVSPHPA